MTKPTSEATPLQLSLDQIKAKKRAYWLLFIMLCSSITIDQVSKVHAEGTRMVWSHPTNLDQYQGSQYNIWHTGEPPKSAEDKNFFLSLSFNYVRNQGAAWGAFSDMHDKYRVPFFFLVTIIATSVISYLLYTTPLSFRLMRYTLTLVFSGAIGNFIDRYRLGYVIDWIDVEWNILGWYYRFPNFNFADSCISVGMVLFFVDALIIEPRRERFVKAYLQQQASSS